MPESTAVARQPLQTRPLDERIQLVDKYVATVSADRR
jgi:hypothetical protein